MYRRLSMVLAVVWLAGVLVGFAPSDEPNAKAALGPLQAVTVTAADFHPVVDGGDFDNVGYYLQSDASQLARIPFPAETVVLTSVKARAYDNFGSGDLCLSLYRARLVEAAEDYRGTVCTSGSHTDNPQTLSLTAFMRVGGFHTAYVWASFGAKTYDLRLYGVTVFYRVVT